MQSSIGLPNILTITRMIATPLLLIGIVIAESKIATLLVAIIFGAISLTDALDGYYARKFKVESDFGRCFDPIADKVLVVCCLVTLLYKHRVDIIPCIIIIIREILVSGLREFVANKDAKLVVSSIGKWKTTIQYFAIIILLVNKNTIYNSIGNILLWIASAAALISMYQYIVSVKLKISIK